MKKKLFATVTIQTYNRAGILVETLESLRLLRCPENIDYEILVVDNNSSDETQGVLKKYQEILAPRLRSVFEEQQGLSYARNRALKEAKGEIVCFLDDDVKVDTNWLIAVTDAFKKYDASVVGGRSYLIYPDSRPTWLPAQKETLLSQLDYGDKPLINTDKELFGLNYSVSRQMALDTGGFDIRLGRKGKKLSCGEEKKLQDKIQEAGGIIVYEPKAVVGHIVSPERLTKKWFFKRAYAGGISKQRILVEQGKTSLKIGDSFLYSIRCWCGIFKSMLAGKLTPEQMFNKQINAFTSLGKLVETIKSTLNGTTKHNQRREISNAKS